MAPISLLATGTFVMVVHPSLPARDVKALIALARSKPGQLRYGSAGVGSSSHLAGELFNYMARVSIVQVPYKSATSGAVATASGEIEMNFPSVPGALPLLAGGKVRALAVTSIKRASMMLSVPTLSEAGLTGYDRTTWHGVAVPTGTPQEVVARMGSAIDKAVNSVDVREAFIRQGIEPQTMTPAEMAAHIRHEIEQGAKLIKLSGAKQAPGP